jgi:thiosulfate dehydrogenase [quinone] large subunit
MEETPVVKAGAMARLKWAWGERRNEMAMTGLRWTIGLLWINSALGKLSNANFAASFKSTNTGFASKTPFGWYGDFLKGFVIPNADWFGWFLAYGELFVGIAFVLGLLTHVGAVAGFFMNVNFWLASGYAGGSTGSVNILMATVAVLVLVSPGAKWFTLDRWLAQRPLKGLASRHPRLAAMMVGRKFVA